MPRAAVPTPKAAAKAPIPLRQKPLPLPNKSKGVKPSTPTSKSPTGDVPTRAIARAIPKVKALTPAPNHDNNVAPAPSHDPNMALHRAHEALQRDYEALQHEHDALLLKHNDSVHSCLLLLEELKERQPSVEPPGRGRGKAPWKQPPAAFDKGSRDALPAAGWQRHTWPQPDRRAPEDPELAVECPPSSFQRRASDELCSEEEGEEEGEEGSPVLVGGLLTTSKCTTSKLHLVSTKLCSRPESFLTPCRSSSRSQGEAIRGIHA